MIETMYTVDGQEVHVKEEAGTGYLGCHVYSYEDDMEPQFGQIQFFKKEELYEKPPIEKYNKEISGLKQEITWLKQKRKEIQNELAKVNAERAKLKDFPVFNKAVKYLNGDYEYLLIISDFSIKKKSEVYMNKLVRVTYTNEHKSLIVYDSSHGYTSDQDKEVVVFDDLEDAKNESEKRMISTINRFYWMVDLNKFSENMVNNEVFKRESVQAAFKIKETELWNKQRVGIEENIVKKKQELEQLEKQLKAGTA